jgi:hypothetical protein
MADRKFDEPVIVYQNISDPMNIPKAAKWYSDPANNAEYRRPLRPGEKTNQREEPGELEGYEKGGPVQRSPKDLLPPDERKLRDQLNVNEYKQERELGRMQGRDAAPLEGPPVTSAPLEFPSQYNKGGRVKHGSDTRVVCKDKFHG